MGDPKVTANIPPVVSATPQEGEPVEVTVTGRGCAAGTRNISLARTAAEGRARADALKQVCKGMGYGPTVLGNADITTVGDMSIDVAENGQICATGQFIVSNPVCELRQIEKPRPITAPATVTAGGGAATIKAVPTHTPTTNPTVSKPASRTPSQPDSSLDAVRGRANDAFDELDEF